MIFFPTRFGRGLGFCGTGGRGVMRVWSFSTCPGSCIFYIKKKRVAITNKQFNLLDNYGNRVE